MIYIAEANEWNYQVFNHYSLLEIREKRLRVDFDYEYILVSKLFDQKNEEELSYYQTQSNLLLIDKLEIKPHLINLFLD
jgi:hypothetical protein